MYRFAFILTLLVSTIYAQNKECPGYVFEREVDGVTFTGQCSVEGPIWGVTNYDDGEAFQGYYSDGGWGQGIYTMNNGEYFIGSFQGGVIFDTEYFAVGTYVIADGNFIEGYFDSKLQPIGFGSVYNGDEYYMGMLDGYAPNGVLTQKVTAPEVFNIYGTYVDGELNGITFFEFDNGSRYKQYFLNDEAVGEPISITQNDEIQLSNIKEFISLQYAELANQIGRIDKSMDEYSLMVEAADAEIEATTKQSKFASKRSLVVKSIQELLTVLGYVPGRADGILGPLTNAAILAFQEDQNIEEEFTADENLLVELQKQVRRESFANAKIVQDREPQQSGTGTGFYVDSNILVTNQHVVDECVYVTDAQNNKLDLVTVDRINDLAILRTPVNSDNSIYLDDDPALGEAVYVAGFPYNFDTLNFTSGAVSALVGPERNITQFQFTAPIQPGNSGGPVLNAWGSLIGVTFASIDDMYILENSGTIPQNINYGIKLDVVKDLLIENNINFSQGRAFWFQPSQEDVAQLAKETTIMLSCFR